MLKKLFKYEWKFFWKVPTAINAFLIIITIVGVISLASPFWTLDILGMDILLGLAIFFYILAIVACSIAVTVYIAVRYYKNVYTDEGYLTNTLPVTARQIVVSKLFTAIIWSFLTSFVVAISIFSLVYTAMLSYAETDLIYGFMVDLPEFLQTFHEEMKIGFPLFLLLLLIQAILSTALSILKIYAAIALGQLFTKHKVAGAFLWYIGEYVVFQVITSFSSRVSSFSGAFTYVFGFGYYNTLGDIILPSMITSILFSLVFCAGLYFVTEHMLKNQLNLD